MTKTSVFTWFSFAFCFLLFVACKSPPPVSEKIPEPNSSNAYSGSMQDLKLALNELLPLVVDPGQYNLPQNQKVIDEKVKRLVTLSRSVTHSPDLLKKDPSIQFLSKAFSEDVDRINQSLKMEKREFARYNLMNLTSYCIECHTRTSTGPSFHSVEFSGTLSKLSGLDRGEYLLATRRFDSALKEFSSFIDESLKQQSHLSDLAFNLDRAVRYSLSITVKYLKNPKKSMEIVQKLKNAPGAPFYLQQNVLGWEKAIKNWMKEKRNKDTSVNGILKMCRQWIREGREGQGDSGERGGDIYFLRALSDLHLILSAKLTPNQLGEALYLTGLGYEAVRDLSIWTLHENYYESCIRKVPHSEWSAKCYRRFEESVYFGYTGSSGVQIPAEAMKQLEELKALALRPE